MPRGVYARKSAQHEKAKRASRARAAPAAVPPVPPVAPVAKPAQTAFSAQDFRMAIEDMEPLRLHAYARSIGIMQRDVDGLTEDRLRQNCRARVLASIED